uniref:Cupin type-1 domain-containing protein n=1 Tax=Kalanchoe fedtschenkoi TaxID=63787 RepID=A0A7N0ZSU3_KALFE
MTTMKTSPWQILCFTCLFCVACLWVADAECSVGWGSSLVVRRDERKPVLVTEFGEISAVEIGGGARNGSFHLQFFKLEPNALFLPVMLHAEMLLYCHSGSGDLTWVDQGKKTATVSLTKGDVYRVRQGSVFFVKSNLETSLRERLRITALFPHAQFSPVGPYSSIADLVRGFDSSVLQAAFQVPEEVIQTIKNATEQPLIIQDVSSQQPEEGRPSDWEGRFVRAFLRLNGAKMENKKQKHKEKKRKESKAFNVFSADPDFENCNGWSLTVGPEDLEVMKDSTFGAFYVNLTKGAMMAPHWNPTATEVAFVVGGRGMVRVVGSSAEGSQAGCESQSFKVEEGDVFVVPRFHPMSQTSFNNESFVFMGFSTTGRRNYPQYLVGRESVFQGIDKDVLAAAFNVENATVAQLVGQQEQALIVECTSCAEEQYSAWQEEIQRRREEEERKRREEEEARRREEEEEEEARRREEEEERRRKEEEEEAKRREEEEARERERQRQEEEAAREEEEEKKRREEQARREEEERRQREEEARRQEEERAEQERRKREEEARREEEERERQRREEEEGRGGGGGETEEEAARREQEERERREREEQEGRGGGGSGEGPAGKPEEKETGRQSRRGRQQPEEEGSGGRGREESEGEAAMRQEEERIRREREQMEHGRSAEAPIILVDNLDKVVELLF